jgi:hypothetical protein
MDHACNTHMHTNPSNSPSGMPTATDSNIPNALSTKHLSSHEWELQNPEYSKKNERQHEKFFCEATLQHVNGSLVACLQTWPLPLSIPKSGIYSQREFLEYLCHSFLQSLVSGELPEGNGQGQQFVICAEKNRAFDLGSGQTKFSP